MVLCREYHIARSRIAEDLCPLVGIPLPRLPVEDRSKVVVAEIRSVVFAVISLRRRARNPHDVQVPLGIGVELDVVGICEVVLRMRNWRPAWNRVQSPVDEYPQLRPRIPLWERVAVQRFE